MKEKLIFGILSSGIVLNAFASGYKIPEQSLRSMGSAAAYFSSANSADASFYNPANMSFLKDEKITEIGLRYIHLGKIKFEGQVLEPVSVLPSPPTPVYVSSNANSKEENFYVPYFHFVSSSFIKNARLGISFITPAGLSKRWENRLQKATAEEFTLKVYELDTSVSYRFSNLLSIGLTGRLVYSQAKAKYRYTDILNSPAQLDYTVSLSGDTPVKTGWGVSLSSKPTENLTLSTIYRSKVILDFSGNVDGKVVVPSKSVNRNPISPDGGDVSVPLPAEWKIGASYTLNKTTFEFTFERTFWSSYKNLNFNFADPYAEAVLGSTKEKNWKDSNAYRVAVYHTYNSKLSVMAGFAYDETPVPEKTLGFELPDSDGYIFSLGGIYSPNNKLEIGLAGLYVTKKDRTVSNANIKGKFSNLNAFLLNISTGYKF